MSHNWEVSSSIYECVHTVVKFSIWYMMLFSVIFCRVLLENSHLTFWGTKMCPWNEEIAKKIASDGESEVFFCLRSLLQTVINLLILNYNFSTFRLWGEVLVPFLWWGQHLHLRTCYLETSWNTAIRFCLSHIIKTKACEAVLWC